MRVRHRAHGTGSARRRFRSSMARDAVLSIVLPAYNEERGLADIIERTLAVKDAVRAATETIQDLELIVVDDGSTDQTASIARAHEGVVLISDGINRGYGGALKRGFQAARGRYIGFLDADGTYPPEQFPRLCRVLERKRADIVIGSRMSGSDSAMPLQRYVGNRLFAMLLSWIVGRRVTDTASGMRVFRREVLPRLMPLPDGLHLTPAMSARALHEGLKIVEVPIPYYERQGRSKLNPITDGFKFLNIILSISRLYMPSKFFGVVGIGALMLGFALGVPPILYYLQVQRVEDTEIYRLFAIMVLWVTGVTLLSFGMFADHIVGILHRDARGVADRTAQRAADSGFLQWAGWLGGVLMISAPVLNRQAILEYLTMGRIYVHWVYVLTGAFLFLVGLQLVMGGVLVGIVKELRAQSSVILRSRAEAADRGTGHSR